MCIPDRPATITEFSAAPFDFVEDLCGNPVDAALVAFFAGNQYMALPDLFAAFRAENPAVGSVFYETLPPGIVVEQVRSGNLHMGSLELTVVPDLVAASPAALDDLHADGFVHEPVAYAANDLALLVPQGNPARITGLPDILRPGVRVALPDPDTEGIGVLALDALDQLDLGRESTTFQAKAAAGELTWTTIHHRQSPDWLTRGLVDVAVMWSTECSHRQAVGKAFDTVAIQAQHNRVGTYAAAICTRAQHPEQAAALLRFISGSSGREVYGRYGFAAPPAAR